MGRGPGVQGSQLLETPGECSAPILARAADLHHQGAPLKADRLSLLPSLWGPQQPQLLDTWPAHSSAGGPSGLCCRELNDWKRVFSYTLFFSYTEQILF